MYIQFHVCQGSHLRMHYYTKYDRGIHIHQGIKIKKTFCLVRAILSKPMVNIATINMLYVSHGLQSSNSYFFLLFATM